MRKLDARLVMGNDEGMYVMVWTEVFTLLVGADG